MVRAAPVHLHTTNDKYAEIFKHGQSTQPPTHKHAPTYTKLYQDVVTMVTGLL